MVEPSRASRQKRRRKQLGDVDPRTRKFLIGESPYPSVPLARIIGSDIAHAAPLTLVAGVGHWIAGTVNGTILLSLLVGSPLGVIAGSRAVGWVPERGLRLTLATVLTIVGGKLAL
jgi:uncharacterized membrane protein YfcA